MLVKNKNKKRNYPKTYKGRLTKRQKEREKTKLGLVIIIITALIAIIALQVEASKPIQSHTSLTVSHNTTKTSTKTKPKKVVLSEAIREVTAYNAGDPYQCDDSPCIAANGENICTAIAKGYKRCATNAFPLGTHLNIQGYGECLVVDRMNSRFKNRVDVALPADQKQRAIDWGLQRLNVQVIKYNK